MQLVDAFVMWFNGLFGWEYAGYGPLWAIGSGLVTLVVAYYVIRLALRPFISLFGAEHTKIGSERPPIQQGIREQNCDWEQPDLKTPTLENTSEHDALSQAGSYSLRRTGGASAKPSAAIPARSGLGTPFVQILPLEDFNQSSAHCSRMAGKLADGLFRTLKSIPNLQVERLSLTGPAANPGQDTAHSNTKFVISGNIREDNASLHVTVCVRDATKGDQLWTRRQICDPSELPQLEKAFAVEIAAAVIERYRDGGGSLKPFRQGAHQAEQSATKYPSDLRPSTEPQSKIGQQAR